MTLLRLFAAALSLAAMIPETSPQSAPAFSLLQMLTNKEMRLRITGSNAVNLRIEATTNLLSWTPLILATNANGNFEHIDAAAPFQAKRYYRAEQISGPVFTGDYLPTDDGEIVIHPVFHATLMMTWKDVTICVDPSANTLAQLRVLPRADIVLVTHEHGDHFDANAVNTVAKSNAVVLVSRSVYSLIPAKSQRLTNGATATVMGVTVTAVPAYNNNHPKGNGNGYVLTIGGRNIYISGDTDDVAEMRALRNIDACFICMDGSFNMNMTKAASAVREFRPKLVFPYHYNTQNPATFKQLVGTDLGIEVRLRKWE